MSQDLQSVVIEPFRFSLCADDFAMTPAVSRGILEALDAGSLTATSVMTTSPWWRDGAAALKPYAARADIGLHVNLTTGRPLGKMPRLAPAGALPPIKTFLRARDALPLAEIEAEISRQLDAFETVFGAPPVHIDGHQHVHALPPIRALLLAQLDRRRLHGKVWLRDSTDWVSRILTRGTTLKKALGLAVLTRGFSAAARGRGYETNEGFAGFSNFGEGTYGARFERYLVAPGAHHLVMCHPGYVDDALRALDPVTTSREEELAFFLSPAFKAIMARRGAQLTRMSANL